MISAPDRRKTVELIEEATASGARCEMACEELEISLRTYQRWTQGVCIKADHRPHAQRSEPSNKLTPEERVWVRRGYASFKAVRAYRNGGGDAKRFIMEAVRESREPRFLMMLACSLLGISYQKYSNLMSRLKAIL